MRYEYEATFLAVDVADPQSKLSALGAVRAFPRTPLTRSIFEGDSVDGGACFGLRDAGTRATLTAQQVTGATTIDGTKEMETEVTDLRATAEILRGIGLTEVRHQEKDCEEWRMGEVAFGLDTWPGLPTFLEIEGPDEASVRHAAAQLDLECSHARFCSVDEIYQSASGRGILAEPTLLFSEDEKRRACSAAARCE